MRCQIIQTSETDDFIIKTLIRRVSVWKLFTCIHEVICWVLLRFPAKFKRKNCMSNKYKFAWRDGAAWLPEESEIKQKWRKDLSNCCHLAKLEVLLKLSCWNAALGPGQSHVNLIVRLSFDVCNVFLQTCSHPTFCMLAYCTLRCLRIKDKNKPSKLTFFSVLLWIISKRFIAILLRGRCSRLPVPASFFTLRTVWWRAASETEVKKDSRVSQRRWRFCTVSKTEDGLWRLE